jgi:beta-galactosidase
MAGSMYEEVLRTTEPSAKVVGVFSDGSPALVLNHSGKGETLFVGTFLGVANESQPSAGFQQLMEQVLEWARVDAPISVQPASSGGNPEIRLLEGSQGRLILVFNRDSSEDRFQLILKVGQTIKSSEAWTEETPAVPGANERELTVKVPIHRVAAIFLKNW